MAQFHFVDDYERLVKTLLETYTLDEAMSRAVGGDYERIGQIEAQLLEDVGLKSSHALIDLGCGSGRLGAALGERLDLQSYLGTDIVQALLDYARTKSPRNYRFQLHRALNIPAPGDSADIVCAFSLFTHLLHAETFLYLQDARRVLKDGGLMVFSFLEFAEPGHWSTFEATVSAQKADTLPHLNTFIERNAITTWGTHLGLKLERFLDATQPIYKAQNLGQAVAVLRKTG